MEANHAESTIDATGLTVGVVVGVPAAVGVAALMATARSFFGTTNAALVLMIVVVAVAALGGRVAGIVTALAAVVSFDFFHTEPYLSLAIDSARRHRDDGAAADRRGVRRHDRLSGRLARRREGSAQDDIRRIHRVAEAAATGADAADVVAAAQDELRELLTLRECRFEALPADARLPRIGRNGAIEGATTMRYGRGDDGRGGFELPADGVELPVLARGQHIGRFVLVPTPGVAVALEQRVVAVAIADQVAAIWIPIIPRHQGATNDERRRRHRRHHRLLRPLRPLRPLVRPHHRTGHGARGRDPMIAAAADNWIGLGLSVLLTIYLVVVLVRPEKF